jgi:hypothetical protein
MINIRLFLIILLFVGILYVLFWSEKNVTQSELPTFNHSIKVEGTSKYIKHVQRCLDLLASKSKEEYIFVELYVGVISQHGKSGMRAWENPPRYQMGDLTAYYSHTWCAGSIAHDA